MAETQTDNYDALCTEWKIGLQLDSRARCFHRAVERLFHAKNSTAAKASYLAAERRWTEVRRALRRYERIGGQPFNRTWMLYHLAEAQQLWACIKLKRWAAPTEGDESVKDERYLCPDELAVPRPEA